VGSYIVFKSKIANTCFFDMAFFLTCFVPYLSFFVLRGMDVQPLFLPIAFLFLIIGLFFRHWRFDWYEWVLLGAALIFILYMNWFGSSITWDMVLRKNTALLFGWIILVYARRSKNIPVWVLYFLSGAYLFSALMQLISPGLYNDLIVNVMNEVRTQSARGVTGLCPEPSFLSMIGVCFLAFLLISRRTSWLLYFFGVLLSVFSRSATGLGVLIIFLSACLISRFKTFVKLLIILPVALFLTWGAYRTLPQIFPSGCHPDTRAGGKSHGGTFSSAGKRWNVFSKGIDGIFRDPSCQFRLISVACGLQSLRLYPLGTGAMFDPNVANLVAEKTGIIDELIAALPDDYIPVPTRITKGWVYSADNRVLSLREMYREIITKTGHLNPLSVPLQRMGFVFVGVFALFFSFRTYWNRENWPILVIILFGWGFSTPLVYPPFWYLLGKMLPVPGKEDFNFYANQPDNSSL
jgi:hypothetical protein